VIDMMTEKEELGDFQVFFLRVSINVCVYVCQTPTYSCVYDGEGVSCTYLHMLPPVPDTGITINF
jgi:hypothetical protein